MLIALAQATTKGIRFTSLKWQPDNSLYLSGTYDSRETLLKFKTDLEKEFITITEFPIVNLLKQKDGEFILKGNIIWKPN
jgi:hypothetical protein